MTDTTGNPHGAGYRNAITNGAILQQYVAAEDLPLGSVVEIQDYAGPGTASPPAVPKVALSSETPDTQVIGVVVDGDINGTGIVPAGLVATVLIDGVCQVLADGDIVEGYPLVQSPENAGAVEASEVPASRTVGIALQSLVIEEGTALIWAYIDPGTQPLPASDSIATDLTFTSDTVGPVLTDQSDGHTYRIISTAGVLSTEEVS